MGRVKKPLGTYGRLYEKAISRPGIRELAEKHNQKLKSRAMSAALRGQPMDPLPPLFDIDTLQKLMLCQAFEAEENLSERQARIAQKARKGLSQKLLLNAADHFAKVQWDAGVPIGARGWRTSIADYVGVQWRTVKKILPDLDLSEDDLLQRMRQWKPTK